MARRRRSGCLGWVFKVLGGFVILLVLLAIVGAIYQHRATAADRARYTPPGGLVTVEGRQLHIDCRGEGRPTIVLDAGQGGWSITWAELMPRLSKTTRVCAYDRAGYGWSEPASDDRGPQAIADDLAALLDVAGVDPPYVVAAFSATGLSARLFAAQHPEDVVGMVLVDPATEFDNELLGEALRQQQQSTVGLFRTFELAARLGVVRLLDPREMAPYAPFIAQNPTQPDIYYSFVAEPRWWQVSRKEFAARLSDEALAYVRDHGVIPDIPLVVIGAKSGVGNARVDEARLQRLRQLAGQSLYGRFVFAEGSSHEVVRDRPDVVSGAVLEVVEAARRR